MNWKKIGVAVAVIGIIAVIYTATAAPFGWGGYGYNGMLMGPMGMDMGGMMRYGMPMMYRGYGMPVYDYQYLQNPQNPSNQNMNETPEQYPQTYNVPYGYYGGWHCPMMGYW
jgi:hypothetical protein